MATAGTLNLVLSADSSQLRQELSRVRQDAAVTASAFSNLFGGDAINAAGLTLARGTIVGLINDIDEMNAGLAFSESLTRNLAASFNDLGDIALLQLGQIAQFLGEDLFETPLAGLQEAALERSGLGQLSGAFQLISAGANAAAVAGPILDGITTAFASLDGVLADLEGNARTVAAFFSSIGGNAQLAGSILSGVADLIDGAIDEVIQALSQLNPAFGVVVETAKELGFEFKLGRSLLAEYVGDLKRLEDASAGTAAAFDSLADGTKQARRGIGEAGGTVSGFAQNLQQQRKAAEQAEIAMRDLADAGVLFDVYNTANDTFERFFGTLGESFEAAKQFENLTNRLQVTSSSAGGAAEDLEFLSEVSDELGVNFDAAAEGFAQLSASTQNTALAGEQAKQIFEDVAQATAVMRLSAADTSGVFMALRQSISGGTVQLEELNQLAERIPGVFQAAAAALGVTTAELRGLVSSGQVQSLDFVPKFAQQLAATTDAGVVGAAQSAEAAVNRFNNALGNLQIAMGQTWLEVGTPALNTFANALNFAAKNEQLLSTAIDALLVAAGVKAVAAFTAFTKSVLAGKATLTLFGQQISITAAQLGTYAKFAGAAYVGTLTFYAILERLGDGAEETRTSIAALDRSLVELREAYGENNEPIAILPEKPPPTDWLDTILSKYNEINSASNRAFGVPEDFLNFTTNAEKQLNDLLVAIGDFSTKAGEVLQESFDLRSLAEAGQGPIKELERIDATLKRLENRKLEIDPGDAQAIAAIAAEEEALLKRRAEAQKQVLATQSAVNNALSQAQQQLKALDPSKLGTQGYEQAKTQLETQIKLLEDEKAALDGVAQTAVKTSETIATSFKDSSADLEKSFADQRAAIAEALSGGDINEDQAREQSLQAEQEFLEKRLQLNRDKADELRTELERVAKLRAIDPTAANAVMSVEDEKKAQDQLRQLELETAQTRIDLATRVRDAKKAELEKELDDIRQANEEAQAAIERSENDRIAAIRQRQLEGRATAEEAQAEIDQIRQNSITKEIDLARDRLAQISDLEKRGVLDAKQAAEERLQIEGEISQLNVQRIEQEIAAREAANRRILEGVQRANEQAQQAIERSQQERITAVRQAQLQGAITEEEAQRRIDQVQQEASDRQIERKQQELREINRLRQEGVLSAEEAADREAELTQEIGQLNLRRIEQEIEAQRALAEEQKRLAEERIAATFEPQLGALDSRRSGAQGEADLSSARLNLQQSLNDLENERLNTAIAIAEAAGNELEVDRLKVEQQQLQAQQAEALYQARLQELEIQQELKAIELERQLIEAQMALARAEAEGASQREIEAQQRLVDLAEQAIARQQTLNQLERAGLETQRQVQRERERQQQIQQQAQQQQRREGQQPEQAGQEQSGSIIYRRLSTGQRRTDTREAQEMRDRGLDPSLSAEAGEQRRIEQGRLNGFNATSSVNPNALRAALRGDQSALANLSRSLSGSALNMPKPIQAGGIDSNLQSTIQSGNQALVAEVQGLRQEIRTLASSPRSLTVQAPNPVQVAGAVLSAVSKQAAGQARL